MFARYYINLIKRNYWKLYIWLNNFQNTLKKRHKDLVKVDCPILLISQIQRSGGTLLNQLFDDHVNCLSYPNELYWGNPKKWNWPEIETILDKPKKVYKYLNEKELTFRYNYIRFGYSQGSIKKKMYPFIFNTSMQKNIFIKNYIPLNKLENSRQIFNLYMMSFFNSWLDYQNIYGYKKFIVTFIPRVNMYPDSVKNFFKDYPDGFIITTVRDPGNWWTSAREHGYNKLGIEKSLSLWQKSANASFELSKCNNRVILVVFEELIEKFEGVMDYICNKINLKRETILNHPTFNSIPIYSNSSFESKCGIDKNVLKRKKVYLNSEERNKIKEFYPLYNEIRTYFRNRLNGSISTDLSEKYNEKI